MKRNTGKKIAFGFYLFALLGLVVSAAMMMYTVIQRGASDVLSASLFATTIFFASCAVVLYFMAKPPRYELLPWDHEEPST